VRLRARVDPSSDIDRQPMATGFPSRFACLLTSSPRGCRAYSTAASAATTSFTGSGISGLSTSPSRDVLSLMRPHDSDYDVSETQ